MDKDAKALLSQIFKAAVAAADPFAAVRESLALKEGSLFIGGIRRPLSEIENIYVVGAGKAAYRMALAAEEVLGGLITEGAVVTKDGHGGPLRHAGIYEASHPVPDRRGVAAADRILEVAGKARENDIVLCLFSGGASALMARPAEGISLDDKQAVTRLMLTSGADIAEVNCVRKHISGVKGGRLAEAAWPAPVFSLIVSDVVGDDLGTIASGPTAPDNTTYRQAAEILKMRGVYGRVPEAVRAYLEKGSSSILPETPKAGAGVFKRTHNIIVASNLSALRKAAEVAGYLGYGAFIFDAAMTGEARVAASALAEETFRAVRGGKGAAGCLITGGETTVTVRGSGRGGRNTEMALAFALAIDGARGIRALFAGTDGTAGDTEAAGAFVDGDTVLAGGLKGVDARKYLDDNDSYRYFEAVDGLLVTGPTGTNVMDMGIILVG